VVASGLTVGAVFEMMRPNYAWAQVGKETHPASARVLDQLRTRFTFQISVDVTTLQQGWGLPCGADGRRQHRRNGDATAQE